MARKQGYSGWHNYIPYKEQGHWLLFTPFTHCANTAHRHRHQEACTQIVKRTFVAMYLR